MSSLLFFGLILTLFIAVAVHGYEALDGPNDSIGQALVPETNISGIVGLPAILSCQAEGGRSLDSCRWSFIDRDRVKHIVEITPRGVNSSDDTPEHHHLYEYTGNGLSKGDCTMTIKNLTEAHGGPWECTLHDRDDNNNNNNGSLVLYGKLQVEANERVSQPYFDHKDNLDDITFNETFPSNTSIVCCVDGGYFSLQLAFHMYLDNAESAASSGSLRRFIRGTDPHVTHHVCRSISYNFQPGDYGKVFTCKVTYTHNSKEYSLIGRTEPIRIKYSPRFVNSTKQQINSEGVTISVDFKSNPESTVNWYVIPSSEEFHIGNNTKYKMYSKHVKGDEYTAFLEIYDVSPEDYERTFKIKVANKYGEQELRVKIISPNPGDESEAYWLMIIIGVCALVFLLILAVIVFVVLRRRGRRKRGRYSPAVLKNRQASVTYRSRAADDDNVDQS